MTYIICEEAETFFCKNEIQCNNGDTSVFWLLNANINTQNRAYQREKVSTETWKQNLMLTVLLNTFAGIPEIHIRVVKTKGGYKYELIDGQQRVTAITDYLDGVFLLPAMVVDGCDVGGMDVEELRAIYPAVYDRIMNYRISCKWYEELTDLQTAWLFIKVLNNVNDMKHQEIRNAILGFYANYVRDTARGNKDLPKKLDPHPLFERVSTTKKGKKKDYLKNFSTGFKLKGRMEVDEWLSELLYLKLNGVRQGVNHAIHKKWVEDIQSPNGEYIDKFADKKMADDLLNFALTLLKAIPPQLKIKLNPMTSMMLVLYADDVRQRFGSIVPEKFVPAFFDVYNRWSDTDKRLYANELCDNKVQMPPFNELFGGKNSNAIKTMFSILDREFFGNPLTGEVDRKSEVGIIEIDQRDFKRADVIRKWQEQGGLCYYTDEPIDEDNLAGDHFIPRSMGTAMGGVTEYSNLVVCSMGLNNKKSNMNGDEFKKMLQTKDKEAA